MSIASVRPSGRAEFVTLSGGLLELDLERGRAILTAPSLPGPDEVIHPYLSSLGAMAAYFATLWAVGFRLQQFVRHS